MNTKIKKQLFVVTSLLFQCALWAQPGGNNDDGNLEGTDPPAASIATSLYWLVLIGLVLAYCVIVNSKNKTRI